MFPSDRLSVSGEPNISLGMHSMARFAEVSFVSVTSPTFDPRSNSILEWQEIVAPL